MKKGICILVFVAIIIMVSCQGKDKDVSGALENTQQKDEVSAVAEKINANILSAMDELKNGKVAEGAELLLEAVLLTKPEEYMVEGFEKKISSARHQFQDRNITEGVELVSEALRMIESGEKALEREEKKELEKVEHLQKKDAPVPVAEIVKNKILAAHQEFQDGNADKGVVLLLESIRLFGPHKD
jgi:hypothetical protein